jgi:hypothetical protein
MSSGLEPYGPDPDEEPELYEELYDMNPPPETVVDTRYSISEPGQEAHSRNVGYYNAICTISTWFRVTMRGMHEDASTWNEKMNRIERGVSLLSVSLIRCLTIRSYATRETKFVPTTCVCWATTSFGSSHSF